MAVEIINLKYDGLFKNENIVIQDNQITSIVGKNGSGKTTLLKLIYNLDTNFIEKISIGEKIVDRTSLKQEKRMLRESVAYLQQDYRKLIYDLDIYENIKENSKIVDLKKMNLLLKSFKLDENILKKDFCSLSNGELKKYLIVYTLSKKSKVILLDDVLNGLDQKSIDILKKVLKQEKRDGKTIILTTQNSDFLLNVCDSVVTINDKKVKKYCNKYEFFEDINMLKKVSLIMPEILKFRKKVLNSKKIKLIYRDNTNDLIKDIYRNAK